MTKKCTTQLMPSLRSSLQIQWRRLKVKGWEKPFPTNANQKKTEMGILIWDTVDFRTKLSTRAKETQRLMTKGSIRQGQSCGSQTTELQKPRSKADELKGDVYRAGNFDIPFRYSKRRDCILCIGLAKLWNVNSTSKVMWDRCPVTMLERRWI